MNEKATALKILEYAMGNERLGYRFYMNAMEATTNEKGKKMFHSIASEEMEHLKILQKEADSLKKTGQWVDLEQSRSEAKSQALPSRIEPTYQGEFLKDTPICLLSSSWNQRHEKRSVV